MKLKTLQHASPLRLSALVVLSLGGLTVCTPLPASAAGEAASSWITKKDLSQALAQQANVTFAADTTAGANTLYVDENTAYQTIEGLGASLTDSSAWLIKNKLSAATQSSVMTKLFDPVNGIGVSWLRQPMGASDFSASGNYSYDDMPAGQQDDASLSHFSIAHDKTYIVPLLKQALTLNPKLKVMITPWSPPAWMKSGGTMNSGTLNASAYGPLATYFAKTIKAFQAEGVPIFALTVQNEPLFQTSGYPSMSMSAGEQTNFIRNNLGPTLAAQGLTATKILGYDHNWDQPGYMQTLYADSTAANYLSGSAWHFYGGDVQTMNDIHYQYPNKDVYFTEGSSGTWVSDQFDANITNEINIFRNWAKSYTDWNIALDTNHGPLNGGCGTCTALVTINQATGGATYTGTYYAMGQISKFVTPGARRIASTGYSQGLYNVAFKNTDGSKVLVVYNQNGASSSFKVRWGNSSFSATIPATSIVTYKWSGTQTGATVVPVGDKLLASAYMDMMGTRPEASSDTGGGQDIGHASNGSYVMFKSVDLTGATYASLRTANGSSNTTIELHADSATGPLLGTVAANATGGWQTWATSSANLTGASGVHDLYLVFRGSVNLNWVQLGTGTGPGPGPGPGTNLLSNPGLETGALGNWSDWHPTGQAAAHQVDNDTPRTGTYKLTHYAGGAYEQTTYQNLTVANGTYSASVWVRSGGGQNNLRLEASNYGGGILYSQDLGSTAYPSTWTQLTLNNINVTNGAITLAVHSKAPGGNWAAFDDFALTKN